MKSDFTQSTKYQQQKLYRHKRNIKAYYFKEIKNAWDLTGGNKLKDKKYLQSRQPDGPVLPEQ